MGYAIATLIGLDQMYQDLYDKDIFDGIVLHEDINKEILVDRIFERCGEFSIGHTDPDYLHHEILNFFLVHKRTFDKMMELSELEYNPIENYDRQETWRDDGTYQNNSSVSTEGATTSNNTQETKNLKTDYSSFTEDTRAADNSSSYENYEKHNHGGNDTVNGKVIDDGGTTNESETTGNDNGTNANVHTGRVHGNIGVTTTQQMIESSLELEPKLNIYIYIADLFANEMCIQVY